MTERTTTWKVIAEDTAISLALVVILISAAAWMATLHTISTSNTVAIQQVSEERRDQDALLRDMASRIARIEGKLDRLGKY